MYQAKGIEYIDNEDDNDRDIMMTVVVVKEKACSVNEQIHMVQTSIFYR